MQADDTSQSVAAVQLLEETGECTFDCDQSSVVHVLTNLLRYIITSSSVKSLVYDGRSLVVGDIYGGSFTGFAIVLQ